MNNQTTKSNYTEMYNILKTRLDSLESETVFLQNCLDLLNKKQNKQNENKEIYNNLQLKMLNPLAYENNRFEGFPKENISFLEEMIKEANSLTKDLSEINDKPEKDTKEIRRKKHKYFNTSRKELVKIILYYEDKLSI